MLYSEIRGWQWMITWDNPVPADSSAIIAALQKLGRVTKLETVTTHIFAPKKRVNYHQIRAALTANLNPTTGKVAYTNLKTGNVCEWVRKPNIAGERSTKSLNNSDCVAILEA